MATRYLVNLLKVFLYYLLVFALCRLAFLAYFSAEVMADGPAIFLVSVWKALPLDISTASYLLFVPLILLLADNFFLRGKFLMATKGYILFSSVIIIVIAAAEIGIYREMHVKMYFNLLSHLAHPAELFLSVSWPLFFTMLLMVVVLVWLCSVLLQKMLPANYNPGKLSTADALKTGLVFLMVTGILVIGCRGGLQPIPINEGEVYFSHNQCVNDATVNPLWNIVHSYVENKMVLKGDSYKVMSDEEAQQIVESLFEQNQEKNLPLFKIDRPNICFLILESWSADVVASLGGYEGLTPNFENMVKEGYLFTNIKPAGHVSDQGIPAILSGYPALPIGSAINQPERQVHLPCINSELQAAGYSSSFFFGGQLIYGNIKSYIYRNNFSRVMEQQDLPATLPAGRLGINDSIMLSIWHDSILQMKPPFFTCLFTLSTHSPFDMPDKTSVGWGGNSMPYLNSIVYADRQIGKFFETVRDEAWYDSTIFIVVADHSHGTPRRYTYCTPEYYHIPLLICGGALKDEYRGKQYTGVGSQTDIASTLLCQLKLDNSSYRWSKNLLHPGVKHFGFYTFNEGFGYVEADKHVVWNKTFPQLSANTAKGTPQQDSLYRKGAAILQVLMKDFLEK